MVSSLAIFAFWRPDALRLATYTRQHLTDHPCASAAHYPPCTAPEETTVTGLAARFAFAIVDWPDPVPAGSTITYAIIATNDDRLKTVCDPDDLPNGAALVSVTPSAGSCNETDPLSCSVGTIAAGGTVMLTLVLRAPSTAGSLPNVVSVTAVEGDRTNNSASATTTTTHLSGRCERRRWMRSTSSTSST